MNQEAVKAWLKRKKSSGAASRCLLAFGSLLAGVAVLFLTFWVTYAIIWFCVPIVSAVTELAFSKKVKFSHEWRLILSGGFLTLLVVQNFRIGPWHWDDYPDTDYATTPEFQERSRLGRAFGLVLADPRASAKLIADILLSGPRLITGSWNLWRESRRFGAIDEDCCSQLLMILASRYSAVPFEELRDAGWEEWFGQVRCIDGVIFLEKGISLSPELRQEFLKLNLE